MAIAAVMQCRKRLKLGMTRLPRELRRNVKGRRFPDVPEDPGARPAQSNQRPSQSLSIRRNVDGVGTQAARGATEAASIWGESSMIIDCHGHVSAPAQLWAYKAGLLAARGSHGRGGVTASDDELRAALNAAEIGPRSHLDALASHGTD